ncbi:hypothetical protein ACO2Q7_07385 [Rathayibacter sp. KR2-224]|uniref:galactose-binding domain-containing protein n=1 Tax=Rathayibacter sp. KR2-224 TaxID=3400913 RepID=UPI003BFC31D7
MRARHWWGLAAAGTTTVVVVALTWAVIGLGSSGDAAAPSAANASDVPVSTASASSSTAVCGFGGTLVNKITANRPATVDAPALTTWKIGGQGTLGALAVAGDTVVVDRDLDNGTSDFLRYSLSGKLKGTTSIAVKHEGRWALADDGSLYVVDAYHGSTRRVVHFAADGSRLGSFDVPKSDESTGHPLDLQYLVWVPAYEGSPALLVGEGTHTVHIMRPSGQNLGLLKNGPDVMGNSLGGPLVSGYSTSGGSSPLTTLDVMDLGSSSTPLHTVYPAEQNDGGTATDTTTSTTPSPHRLASVEPGPHGDGFVLSTAYGVQWVDGVGVRKGVWLAGQDGFSPADPASMAESNGRYWMLVKTGDAAVESVAALTSDQLAARFASPLLPTADVEPDLAQLGLGIGAITHAPFNHFDSGQRPAVYLRTEKGWGAVTGSAKPPIEVRYTVTGDPTLPDPVSSDEKTAAIPWGGGETALALPKTRPGPYEVSLEVVDTSTHAVLSGSCLHYSVGAQGADLNLGSLAAGDDWGGPAPLRGAELAATLGVGSSRVQLDFGSLVPDPKSTPSEASIQWAALPGANLSPDNDPFQNLRKAGVYAAHHGVRLIVQVGSGGDAEKAAAASGTWAGWTALIVATFAREAPAISSWEAFNEPNSFYDSADEYWKTVELPFAEAAHAAKAGSYVIAGNLLGFETDWWKKAAADGVCSHVDAIGVHPYTGWNRSWEEEGFDAKGAGYDALRQALGSSCARLPLWDTESGWTSDSATAYWAQGSNIARKLMWYQQDGIAGWTYFYSEGGWGENDSSWSLIQYRAYVKPGGLAYATVSRMLHGRGAPVEVATGIPFTHAMRVPGNDTMLVAWTDEARIQARVTTGASSLRVTDEYGATDAVGLSGGSAQVTLTATPQFFRAPAGSTIALGATETFGADLLKGQSAQASSTYKDSKAQTVTSGTADPYRPWRSGEVKGGVDPHPSITVPLRSATTIDRIAVATTNIACCEAGLRSYTVSVQKPDGTWQVVARPQDQFWERTVVFRFDPVEAKAVRVEGVWTTIRDVKMLAMNYTGFAGGLPPPFMGLQTTTNYVMSVSAVSAWAAGRSP